jgi:hypothetical protein
MLLMMSRFFIFFFNFFLSAVLHAQDIIIEDPTLNKGKVVWQWRADIGQVKFNEPTTAVFVVENISNEPLIIMDVQAGCRCTVADFTKTEIPSGGKGYIKARYDAKQEGRFYKILTVTTNFDKEHAVVLAMEGKVVKSKTPVDTPQQPIGKSHKRLTKN